jgi:hypothetical protein
MGNMLIYGPTLDHLSPEELYDRYTSSTSEVKGVDGAIPRLTHHPMPLSR